MPERLAAACQQVFINATDQVWLSKKQVSKAIQSLLEVSDLMVVSSIDLLLKKGTIVKNRVGEGEWYGLLRDVEDEEEVARQILSRLNRPGPDWPLEEIANDGMLSPHQKEVVLHNMKNGGRLITLTGSPGVGKTTVLGRIVKYFCDKNDAWPAACAPTGKAAQRLSQSLENSGCSTPATTIHKMLEPVPIDGGWAFKICGHGNYVDADIVAVDEASMLNGWLASHMFRGMHPDTYVILVGDKNQLPPVGPGSMLRDLETLSNFKELTEVRRNAGKIVETCANIRDEKQFTIRPTSSPGVNVTPENNVQMVLAATDSKKSNKVKKLAQSILDGKLDGVKNPIEDVQFMTATHKNSHVGRIVLNKVLQEMFNPKGGGEHKHYRVGDKVIATDNARIKGSENALGMKECVANGEIGYVIESRPKQIVVRMAHDGTELIINCGEDLGNGWDLAYVTTVHKFQGSECPVSITIMGDDFGSHMVMDRSWFYTAISRGKTTSIVIATPDLVRKVVRKNKINDRKSFTLEYMEELKSEIAKMPVDNGV
jgi:exodeoxyribonuclease V alpha subunit